MLFAMPFRYGRHAILIQTGIWLFLRATYTKKLCLVFGLFLGSEDKLAENLVNVSIHISSVNLIR